MSRGKILDNLGVSAFCESMARMAHAGIQTDEAIRLLGQGSQHEGVLGQAMIRMSQLVEEGNSLSHAMEETGIFPEYAIKMIQAGERSGRQEDVLFRLSHYYQDQKTISEKLKAAVTYPAAMMILIVLVLAAMLALVLPTFTQVYNNLTGSLAASTYRYIHWAYVLSWVALIVIVILAVLLIAGALMWRSGNKAAVEKYLWKIPVAGSILKDMGMFRFTSALEIFRASGEMQDMAVIDSIGMTDCKPVEEVLKKCVHRMEEGHSFAQAAYDEELFEPVYGRMLLAGERGGDMESVLARLTALLEENCGNQVDRLVSTVDPVLSGVLMITVGLSLLSVMLPLIGMMNSIG